MPATPAPHRRRLGGGAAELSGGGTQRGERARAAAAAAAAAAPAPMGKAAAPSCSGSATTRGLVALLSAVPCLACKQPQPPPPPSVSSCQVAMSMSAATPEGSSPALCTTTTSSVGPGSDTYKGWLFKWTNYLKGYQRRWFVLSNGLLSYYRYCGNSGRGCGCYGNVTPGSSLPSPPQTRAHAY